MNIILAPFDKAEHLPLVKQWWAFYYEDEEFPEYCVPKHGVVAFVDGNLVGSIFLYVNDTKICQMIFPIVNPDVMVRDKLKIVDELVEGGKKEAAKILGKIGVVFALTHNGSVERSLVRAGFSDTGVMKTLAYPIGDGYIDFIK